MLHPSWVLEEEDSAAAAILIAIYITKSYTQRLIFSHGEA